MSRGSIVLREAEPTLEEGLVFARYLDTAAEGFMRFLYGRRYREIIAEAYTHTANDFSFENVVFAEDAGQVVGAASSFTASAHARFSKPPGNARAAVLGTLLFPLLRILSTVPDDGYYLLALAVDDAARGQGIGSLLIDRVEQQAGASGAKRLYLDVSAKNEGARRLYERRGMAVESRWPRLRLVPPLLLRMAKDLS